MLAMGLHRDRVEDDHLVATLRPILEDFEDLLGIFVVAAASIRARLR
jgi:hypothetical protein